MIVLGLVAIGVLIVFQANVTNLIQLYIIGVFVSFTLGQIGMIRHWRRGCDPSSRRTCAIPATRREGADSQSGDQLFGAITDLGRARHRDHHQVHARRVPRLHRHARSSFTLMIGVNRYYRDVEHEIAVDDATHFGSTGDVAIILVNKLQKPVAQGHRLRDGRQARARSTPSTSRSTTEETEAAREGSGACTTSQCR